MTIRGVYIINIKYKAERSTSEWKTAFSTSQLISVIILITIAVYLWYLLKTRKNAKAAAPSAEEFLIVNGDDEDDAEEAEEDADVAAETESQDEDIPAEADVNEEETKETSEADE